MRDTFKVHGVVRWASVQKPKKKYKSDDEFEYSIDICPSSKEQLNIFKQSGVRNKPKVDDDGNIWFTLKRPYTVTVRGEVVTLHKPAVLNEDGSVNEALVGNGSTCTVKFSTFDFKDGTKGSQLEAVMIHDLVKFEGNNSGGNIDFTNPAEVPF